MACTSGNSSGATQINPSRSGSRSGSGSDDGLVDQRKRKRMLSNRESARRSRVRKQKHIDDLTAESNRIKNDNNHMRATINVTTERFVEIEAENSVLRAQVSELSQRLNSLNEIMTYMNSTTNGDNCTSNQCTSITSGTSGLFEFDYIENPWNMMYVNQQAIMASAGDMFGY